MREQAPSAQLANFADSPFVTVGVLNTSIASENAGDFIIMEAAAREIARCLPLAFKVQLTTHEKLSRTSLRLQKKVAFNVACGTNLLHSHMEIVKQWNVGIFAAWRLKPVVLLGVGWRGHASHRTTFFTKRFLRSLLSRDGLHSVRDSYAAERLREIGINNVVNTACPTMWDLTREHCADIPAEQGEDVVVTLTDYSPEPQKDRQLLDLLKRLYRRVYFWRQGAGDCEYLASIARPGEVCHSQGLNWPSGCAVRILPSSLQAYDELLANRSLSLDYVGTRLHGGIRALQHKRRAWIIGVDHRARDKAVDFQLPVMSRYTPPDDLERSIRSRAACEIHLPLENIRRWREQFADSTDKQVGSSGNTCGSELTAPCPLTHAH
jgi:polysaccharide pyruvyl transferase WcaK-like protein